MYFGFRSARDPIQNSVLISDGKAKLIASRGALAWTAVDLIADPFKPIRATLYGITINRSYGQLLQLAQSR